MGLAGAVLYVSCKNYDEDVTQREIAEAAGVTEVTIRHDLGRYDMMDPSTAFYFFK